MSTSCSSSVDSVHKVVRSETRTETAMGLNMPALGTGNCQNYLKRLVQETSTLSIQSTLPDMFAVDAFRPCDAQINYLKTAGQFNSPDILNVMECVGREGGSANSEGAFSFSRLAQGYV